jgi:cardiolipin synthase
VPTPTPAFAADVKRLLDVWDESPGASGVALGAAVAAAAHAYDDARRNPHIEVVVSGPPTGILRARRTEQILLQLIDAAAVEVLLVTYVMYMHGDLRSALISATGRGVRLTLLAEHSDDDERFTGPNPRTALKDVTSHLLCWPADQRPLSGAAMHAGLVVVDGATALITSANLTKRAAGDNLEVGLLIRCGDIPRRLADHFHELERQTVLRPNSR